MIWENCCACLKGVLSQIEAEKVLGIGITAQGDGLWMIDGGETCPSRYLFL